MGGGEWETISDIKFTKSFSGLLFGSCQMSSRQEWCWLTIGMNSYHQERSKFKCLQSTYLRKVMG